MIPNDLNYDFPIPIENLTHGKCSDKRCWEMHEDIKQSTKGRPLFPRPWESDDMIPRCKPAVLISLVTDMKTMKTWLRFELNEVER